jgi:arylsulfatase A-like enzyme
MGNRFMDRSTRPSAYVDTEKTEAIDRLQRLSGGNFLGCPTLGEILGREGLELAVLSTDSAGSTRILNHTAASTGQICLSGHFAAASIPAAFAREVHDTLGEPPPPPPQSEPDLAGQTFLTDAFLQHIWPRRRPAVTQIWYGEPDRSSHNCGVGHETTLTGLRHCDAELGRLIQWWESEGYAQGVQLAVVSDHGHVTAREKVSATDILRAAGLSVASPESDGDIHVIPGQTLLLYLRLPSAEAIARIAQTLQQQPWCGLLFGPGTGNDNDALPGVFPKQWVFAEHERSPDLYLTFHSDDEVDQFGLRGRCSYEGTAPPGGGTHGGLHPRELSAVCMLAGSAFHEGQISDIPAGVCDLAPTLLHILGLPPAPTMSGRVLHETLASSGRIQPPQISLEVLQTGWGDHYQVLSRRVVNRHRYLHGGWTGAGARAAQIELQTGQSA